MTAAGPEERFGTWQQLTAQPGVPVAVVIALTATVMVGFALLFATCNSDAGCGKQPNLYQIAFRL
jgi:hypothetical protein